MMCLIFFVSFELGCDFDGVGCVLVYVYVEGFDVMQCELVIYGCRYCVDGVL